MNIADLIMALQRGDDPNKAMLASATAAATPDVQGTGSTTDPVSIPEISVGATNGNPAPAGPQTPPSGGGGWLGGAQLNAVPPPMRPPIPPPAPPPKPDTPPEGVRTPVTNPAKTDSQPEATKSPPDLSNMYLSLMRQSQNAAAMDSGLTMIAAGLTPHAATRAALINASGGSSHAGKSISSADIINLQKAQADAQSKLQLQAMKGSLMKQHGLTSEQFDVLANSGKMDEFVKEQAGKGVTKVERPDGSAGFYDHKGNLISEIPGKKTDLDERQLERINEDRKAAGKPPMTTEEFIQSKKPAGTTVNLSPDGVQFPKPDEGFDYERVPEGQPGAGRVKIFADGKPKLYKIEGGKPADAAAEKAVEKTEADKKAQKAKALSQLAASDVGKAVDDAVGLTHKWFASGLGSGWLLGSGLGGTNADDMAAKLSTIKADAAFETLKQMREASKSGASGLGQVTDFEHKMLSSAIADVRQGQSDKSLREALIRVKVTMQVLADDNFGEDPVKFKAARDAALKEEMAKADAKHGTKPKATGHPDVKRIP